MENFFEEFLEFLQAPDGTVKGVAARLLAKCRQIAAAEAGTIFIVRGRGPLQHLDAISSQNDAIKTSPRVFVVALDGHSIAGRAALDQVTVRIDDVESLPTDEHYQFDPSFDRKTGYRTRSVLCFPLLAPGRRTIGVVQLINHRDESGVTPFPPELERLQAPISAIAGRLVEQVIAGEALQQRNRELVKRARALEVERSRSAALAIETEQAFHMAIELLARAAERYDEETSRHVKRVSAYSAALAAAAGLDRAFCNEIRWASALHDVGKVGIDQQVLHKTGRLTPEEFAEMQRHTTLGYEILSGYPTLAMAAEIAYAHHEMWSGAGYPRHLVGETIPMAARIVAIGDVYDALRSARPYKPGFTHEQAVSVILEGDERLRPEQHFDPALLAVFRRHHRRFERIWQDLNLSAGPPGPWSAAHG